jgi:hypothetical protein
VLNINTKAERSKNKAIIKNAQIIWLSKLKNGKENRNINNERTKIFSMLKILFTLPINWLGICLNK